MRSILRSNVNPVKFFSSSYSKTATSYAKLIENAKAQIYAGASSDAVIGSLTAHSAKVPDFVYNLLIDAYMAQNRPSEALNLLIMVGSIGKSITSSV